MVLVVHIVLRGAVGMAVGTAVAGNLN
eukprot:SAG22_NODE_2612_length_2381_cov_2.086766_1_plen_26_part_10